MSLNARPVLERTGASTGLSGWSDRVAIRASIERRVYISRTAVTAPVRVEGYLSSKNNKIDVRGY